LSLLHPPASPSSRFSLILHQDAISGYKMKPLVRLSTETVKLREEYEQGRSSLDEERDLVQYYEYNADNGSLDSLITMGVIYLEVFFFVPRVNFCISIMGPPLHS
jgi:hypothetical protein